MLWWFLILGVSAAVMVSVGLTLYMRVRKQMQRVSANRADIENADRRLPPEA